jgi:hypothetical protein
MLDNTAPKKNIREAIMEVVAFFDVFSYPLTAIEVWQFLNIKCAFSELSESLEDLKNEGAIRGQDVFYFFPNQAKTVKIRLERYRHSYDKFRKIKRIVRLFSYIPWIKMIAVGNSIGANNSRKESDIDLLIITANDRLWISRFFCVLIAMILNQRPNKKTIKDKVCLSFLISERAMDFRPLLLGGGIEKNNIRLRDFPDPYFLYWLACLMPIYDVGNTYEKLVQNNRWLNEHLPNWQNIKPVFIDLKRKNNPYYRGAADLLAGGLDDLAKKTQIRLFPSNIKDKLNLDTCVMADKNTIKLHSNDRRGTYLNKFKEKLTSLKYDDRQ